MSTREVAIVTGASRGIGRLISEHLLSRHARVIGMSRSDASLEHFDYRHFRVDITSEESVRAAFREIRSDYGAVEILVNDAAVITSQHAMLLSGADAEAMIRTNFLGAFLVCREAARLMVKGRYGRIINISSMAVPLAPAGDAVYGASKSALTHFSQAFAKEVGSFGITCNVLGITAIPTDMSRKLPQDKLEAILQSLPIKRMAEPRDITNALDFFASRASDSITGQVLYLGGVF